jgi:GGDEF domain-containing protein
VLLIVLHLHVKSKHTSFVRKNTLADLDPLTGFLAALQYSDTLAHLWSQTRSSRQEMAVAYVRATVEPDAFEAANQPTDDEMVMRCVRMLRMVIRRDDTVARLGKNEFAVLMPGVSLGPNLSNKLLRLISLGIMRDTDDSTHIPVRFRIAVTTFRSYSGTSGQLDAALRVKLNEMAHTQNRDIAFVAN